MPYDPVFTPDLIAYLKTQPGRWFTASDLKKGTGVRKGAVRQALTVDAAKEEPMDGVSMDKRQDKLRYYSWTGLSGTAETRDSN